MHPALVPRENPFLKPVPAWLRDFKTFEPVSIIMASSMIFKAPVRVDIMHRVVHWYRAGLRAGTSSTKHRSDVRGSSRKIYQQKGSGRARAGSIRANQRRGGGRCFGPKPRNYYYSLPLKLRNLGLRSAFSAKFRQGQLSFVTNSSLKLDSHKTVMLADMISNVPAKKVLLIDSQPPCKNLALASRSLKDSINFMDATTNKLNVYHILNSPFILLTERAKNYYEGYFQSLPY